MPAAFATMRFLAIPAVLWASPSSAQTADAALKLSGSVRLRYEAIDGQARAGFGREDELVNLRTQIMADYKTGPVHVVVELFDSRAWGADPTTPLTPNEVNALEPVQAYVSADLGEALGKRSKATVQAGRFTLNLGSRRLVAADDYRNTTNGYTGVRIDASWPNAVRGTFIYTLPQRRLPDAPAALRDNRVELDTESFGAVLWGGIVGKGKVLGKGTAELTFFHFGERDGSGRPTRDRSLDTFGGRVMLDPGPGTFDYEFEGFYQTGHVSVSAAPAAAVQGVRASFGHAEIGYTFATGWHPRVSLELDRASGDKPGGRKGRFDTLFGMRRAELATAGLYNAVGRANFTSPAVRVEATPGKRIDFFAGYRPLWLAARRDGFSTTGVRDASGRAGNFAGHQAEARVRYWLIPARLRFEWNGLLLAKGRFLRDAPNAPPGRATRYVSFNLTASF